jgi:hypothetical protein
VPTCAYLLLSLGCSALSLWLWSGSCSRMQDGKVGHVHSCTATLKLRGFLLHDVSTYCCDAAPAPVCLQGARPPLTLGLLLVLPQQAHHHHKPHRESGGSGGDLGDTATGWGQSSACDGQHLCNCFACCLHLCFRAVHLEEPAMSSPFGDLWIRVALTPWGVEVFAVVATTALGLCRGVLGTTCFGLSQVT